MLRPIAFILLAAALTACASHADAPPPVPTPIPAPAILVTSGDPSVRAVALTFDTPAPDAGQGAVADILATLRLYKVRATFAVTGLWAERHRDLMLSISADGHEFINNTYNGISFTGETTGAAPLTAEERALELSRTETTVYLITGGRSTRPYMRPPYGDIDDTVLRDIAAANYTHAVTWSIDTAAWRTLPPEELVANAIAAAIPGAIYRFDADAPPNAAALPALIDALAADGYAFVTVDEMVE